MWFLSIRGSFCGCLLSQCPIILFGVCIAALDFWRPQCGGQRVQLLHLPKEATQSFRSVLWAALESHIFLPETVDILGCG